MKITRRGIFSFIAASLAAVGLPRSVTAAPVKALLTAREELALYQMDRIAKAWKEFHECECDKPDWHMDRIKSAESYLCAIAMTYEPEFEDMHRRQLGHQRRRLAAT